jgi:purine-binding chemotaxis protein CheW
MDWDATGSHGSQTETTDKGAGRVDHVLRERAHQLAGAPADAGVYDSSAAILVFRYGPSRYGLLLADIAEVITGVKPAKVVGAPAEVAGLMQVRGEICPVFHLYGMLQTAAPSGIETARTVLLIRTGARTVGLLVERTEGIRTVPDDKRRPPPDGAPHISWMMDDLIAVLNPGALMDKEERWRT